MVVPKERSVWVLRNLYRELRFIVNHKSPKGTTVRQTQLWQRIMFLNREGIPQALQTNTNVSENLLQAGETYLNYLRSAREYDRVMLSYKGLGERSVGEMANFMGFSLPNDSPKNQTKDSVSNKPSS